MSGLSSRGHMRFCQSGSAQRGNPKTPHIYWPALGQPSLPNPSLASTGPGPARPTQTPHFYLLALGQGDPPKSLTFIDRARPTQPLTSIGRPLASISQTRAGNLSRGNPTAKRRATGTTAPYFPRFGSLPIWQTLTWCQSCTALVLVHLLGTSTLLGRSAK